MSDLIERLNTALEGRVAYVSEESGRAEVYVRSFPDGGRPWSISVNGGRLPLWGSESASIYFLSDRDLFRASIDFTQGVDVSERTRLFPLLPDFESSGCEPAAEGERLLMIKEGGGTTAAEHVVMLNVFDEIERRLRQ